jgi:hypothetical protein
VAVHQSDLANQVGRAVLLAPGRAGGCVLGGAVVAGVAVVGGISSCAATRIVAALGVCCTAKAVVGKDHPAGQAFAAASSSVPKIANTLLGRFVPALKVVLALCTGARRQVGNSWWLGKPQGGRTVVRGRQTKGAAYDSMPSAAQAVASTTSTYVEP